MMRWRVENLHCSLGKYAAEWDELNKRKFGGHPLLTSLFIEGLLKNFGDGSEHICALEDHGQVLALCIIKKKNQFVWTSFQPSQAQIGATLITDEGLLPSLLKFLPGYVLQLDLYCNDPDFGDLLHNSKLPTQRLNHALTMRITLRADFNSYWNSRSRHMQSNLKRYYKRLAADGLAHRFISVSEPDEISAAIDRYVVLEGAGWKGRQGTALGSTPEQYRFYRDLMLAAAERGNATVYELWLGDKLAASRLVLRSGPMHVMLKTGYDERLSLYSPGRLLLRALIEHACNHFPDSALEFYTDADANLLEWATEQRWIQHKSLYRSRLVADIVTGLRAFRPSPYGTENQVELYHDPADLPAAVQTFMAKAEQRNVSFGYSWYENLVSTTCTKGSYIRFYVLRTGDRILAVLPLRAVEVGGAWHLASLSNFYTSLYEPLFEPGLKSQELVPVLSAIQRDFANVSSMKLAPMDPKSHSYQTLIGAFRIKGWIPFEYFAFGNWYQPVESTWTDYLAKRDARLHNTIHRMGKRFARDGGTFEIISSPKYLPDAIAAYERVYAASWKKPEPFPHFCPGLMQTYANKGFLRLGVARLGERPIAAQIWIVSHGRAEIFKLAYDEQCKGYSPGTLLTALLMQHAFEKENVSEVDYLIGDDPYKKTWMSHRRERWGLVAYNPRSPHGLLGLARESAGRMLKKLGLQAHPRATRGGKELPPRR